MNLSAAGRALIESFEGLRTMAYQDQRGIWTIGYGHTTDVHPGDQCTPADADLWLATDVGAACRAVTTAVDVALSQGQFDALVSLTFNIGAGNFRSSTLLRLLNGGDTAGAADQFLVWNKVNGVENAGLDRRRKAERALFLS